MTAAERAVSPWSRSTTTSSASLPRAPPDGAHGRTIRSRAGDGSLREWRAQKREGPRPIRRHADLRVSLLGSRETSTLHLLGPIFNRLVPGGGGGHEAVAIAGDRAYQAHQGRRAAHQANLPGSRRHADERRLGRRDVTRHGRARQIRRRRRAWPADRRSDARPSARARHPARRSAGQG